MKIENTDVYGWAAAIKRAMRNPKESWSKSDSTFDPEARDFASWRLRAGCGLTDIQCLEYPLLGPKDLHLAQSLIKAGTDHSKFMRQIIVWSDWTMPIMLWSEIDTYKVGTVRNSCSTMHKLGSRELTRDDFQDGDVDEYTLATLNSLGIRSREDRSDFSLVREMKKILPGSYLLKATMTFSYQVLRNMWYGRRAHRLTEWSGPGGICEWIKSLPYGIELIVCAE